MKTIKMAGLLCRSDFSATVCVPDDPRSVVLPRRRDRSIIEQARLIDHKCHRLPTGDRKPSSITLQMVTKRERVTPKAPLTSSSSNNDVFQVVVMRVSIHCQGCAGKVRKHLSKMEGVTSFSVDLESRRVTVMGHVSPVGVLESVSKVKKAEFWPT